MYMYIYIYIHMYIHMHCVYIYIYIYTHIHTHMYTHITRLLAGADGRVEGHHVGDHAARAHGAHHLGALSSELPLGRSGLTIM